jgi:outer membrane protein assembly factor BamB
MTDFLAELREELLDGLDRYEEAPRWRRPFASRGPARVGPAARRMAVAAVAAAVAIAVVVQVADRPPDLEQGSAPEVSRLEGFHATGLVALDGSLWVTQYDTSGLLRIDLQTGKVGARIDVGGSPGAVIAADGALWVHDWERGRLLKVDARANRISKTLRVASSNGDIAFAAGAVWALDGRERLVRIDPATGALTARVSLGSAAPPSDDAASGATLAGTDDTVWVAVGDGDVTEVDARTAQIRGRARGPALPLETARRIGADDSGLWVSSPARREVVHVDARTRRMTRFPVGGEPGPLAIVDGRIWVGTLHDRGTLTRVTVLDRDGRIVATIPLPDQAAVNIVPSPRGGAWVAFGENGVVSPAALWLPSP